MPMNKIGHENTAVNNDNKSAIGLTRKKTN